MHRTLLLRFGLFLIVCGLLGWAATGFSDRGKTAIASGAMSGMIVLACAVLVGMGRPLLRRVGYFAAVGFTLLFGAAFAWRGTVGWLAVASGEPKLYVAALLTVMALSAIAVLVRLIRLRPVAT
jgi:hypothetical protein